VSNQHKKDTYIQNSFTSLVNSFRSLILHTVPTQRLVPTLFIGEAVRSLRVCAFL